MNKKVVTIVAAIVVVIVGITLVFSLDLNKPKDIAPAPSKEDVQVEKEEISLNDAKQLDDEVYFNNASYNEMEELITKKDDLFVFFYKPTCPYCKTASPKVAEVAKEKGVQVISVNISEYPEATKTHNVTKVPTLAVFKNGQIKSSTDGVDARLQNPKIGDDEQMFFTQFFDLYASK